MSLPSEGCIEKAKMTRIGILLFYAVCSVVCSTSCSAGAAHVHELKEALTEPGVRVDVLCGRFIVSGHPLVFYVLANFHVLTWCGHWPKYLDLLKGNIALNINTLIILPGTVINDSFSRDFSSNLEDYPLTKWVVLSGNAYCGAGFEGASVLNSTNVIVRPGDIDFSQDAFWTEKRALRRETRKTRVRLARLANRHLRLGCFSELKCKPDRESVNNDVFQEALHALKVSITMVHIHVNASVKDVNRNIIDIVNEDVVLDAKAFKNGFFPGIRHCHHVVYYAGQSAVPQEQILSSGSFPVFFSFLIASLVACLLTFNMINYCAGRNASSEIADTCMVLVAAALMLSSALPRRLGRSSSGRTVLVSWFVAGFALSVYCQSLLTSSMTTGTRWEADDTPAKLLPKLVEGKVSVCIEHTSYFQSLLRSSVNDTDILGDMSRATKRHPKLLFSGTVHQCFEKAVRRTHVYLSERQNPCDVDVTNRGRSITVGREPIQTLFSGHPVKKGFRYSREIAFIIRRIFETGWDGRGDLLDSWNCSSSVIEAPPIIPVDATRFLTLYVMCCGFAIVVLILETAASRLWW